MSGRWWQPRPEPPPPGPLPDLLAGSEGQDPPATRLRLPASFAVGAAGRQSAPPLPPAERRAPRHGGFRIGTPVSRYGSVKLWRARSVNLRLLLVSAPLAEPEALPEAGPGAARPAGAGPGGERRLSPEELLARRLAALLQPPAEILLFPVGPLEWPASFFPYQRDGIRALLHSRQLLLADDMGLGKAQPLDASVLTPGGWRSMGDLRVGDAVIGADGCPTRVIGVFPQGEKEVFRVTFSDGSVTECCDEHLWRVQTPQRKWRGAAPLVLPLHQIRRRLRDINGNCLYFIPLVGSVEFATNGSCLPLDPYLLGALLGDGGLAHRVMFTTADVELATRIEKMLPEGIRLRRGARYDHQISGIGPKRPNSVMNALRTLGLMGHKAGAKFIPEAYLFASVPNRHALLQGLLDTDGYGNKDGTLQFYSVSTALANGVRSLVQSLGGTARMHLKKTYRQPCHIVSIALPSQFEPFRLTRKRDAYRPRTKYQPTRAIVKVEPAGVKPVQCIAVENPDQLYITDDFVVTHNTIQTIAALRLLFYRREAERALVVTPASLLDQWRREIDLWAPELRVMVVHGAPEDRAWRWQYRAHVSLTSYETLRADAPTGVAASGAPDDPWSVVVLDEAQRIKNRETDLARACKALARERSWALTGTPLENRTEDLISLLEFVTGPGGGPLRATAGVSLRARLGQVQLRRRKVDVLKDLPPKIATDLLLPLAPAQRREYERAERAGVVELRGAGAAPARVEHVLALLTRLKQICNFAPGSGASAKMEDLEGRIEEVAAAGNKALIFTQFTDDTSGARRIAARLERFSPLLYTGATSLRERAVIARRFQEDAARPVLILSLQAGGQGLNLQCASYVFHFDRTWNPAIERQAEDRSHRLGQTEPVHVYRYIMAETIEERIAALLKSKTRLFEEIVEGSSLDPERLLEQGDLYGLLGLAPPGPPPPDPTGVGLEERVAALLTRRGYQVQRVGGRRDGGVDLVADTYDGVGTRVRLLIQCKETRDPAGVEVARGLNGVLPADDRNVSGVIVCPAGFTADARRFAAARHLELWDEERLARLEDRP